MIVGVDGGGTKTVAVAVSDSGRVLGTGQGGPSNYRVLGLEAAAANLRRAVRAALEGNGGDGRISRAVFGLAGADLAADCCRLETALSGLDELAGAKVVVRNDAEVALVGAVAGDRGVAVCAGTGAICVGMNGAHRTARSDGWGYLLGDEGSGYWIGAAALRTLLRRHDGRGRRGRGLEQAMLAALGGIGAPEILNWVYDAPAAVDRIAGLAPVVLAAAASGEPAAAAIVNQAGVRLGRAACAVIRKLELVCETFPLVTLGGLFRSPHATALRTPLENAVRRAAPDGMWRTPVFPAEFGAALLGASLDGEAPDGFIANLRLGLDQGRQRRADGGSARP